MTKSDFVAALGRLAVGGYYDYQSVRTSQANRVRDLIRRKNLGIPLDKVEEKQKVKKYSKDYQDKNLPKLIEKMLKQGKLDADEAQYITKVLAASKAAEKVEVGYRPIMDDYLGNAPIYTEYLSTVRGIGPVLASNLISMIDIRKANHVSSLWKYAGLHVVDGKGPKLKRGEKPGFSPKMRTLCWKVADSFVKHRTKPYRGIYDERKKFYAEKWIGGKEKGHKLHIELAARRYMAKEFLKDLWMRWRTLEGLEVSEPYSARFHQGEN